MYKLLNTEEMNHSEEEGQGEAEGEGESQEEGEGGGEDDDDDEEEECMDGDPEYPKVKNAPSHPHIVLHTPLSVKVSSMLSLPSLRVSTVAKEKMCSSVTLLLALVVEVFSSVGWNAVKLQ